MRAASLYDVVELASLGGQGGAQRFERGCEPAQLSETREPDVGGNRVVGALRHVDVIVRVYGLVFTPLSPEELIRAIREHLVHVHIVRCPGASLVRIDDELVHMLAGQHLIGRGNDRVGEARIEPAGRLVRQRRCLLDPHLRDDEWRERFEPADWKVLNGAERLHAV